jgi:hypothetical protein
MAGPDRDGVYIPMPMQEQTVDKVDTARLLIRELSDRMLQRFGPLPGFVRPYDEGPV